MSPNTVVLPTRLSGLLPIASVPLRSHAGISRSRCWPLDLEPVPLQKRHMIVRCVLFRCLFEMIVFEVLGALYWDRHPFHAPGVCSDVREIRWNMKSTTAAARAHTHTYAHSLSPRDVSQLSCWGRLLASCDCRQISQEQRCRLQRPHLLLPSYSFPFSLPDMSEVEAKASPPHPHISLPPALSSGVSGVEVIDVLRWEWRCRAWIIISPGTEQRSQRTHQSRNRSWQGQMMKSSPSNDPHPRWGGRKGQGRKGLKEETFSEAVCLLYVATKLSFSSRDAFGYSVIRT